MCQADTVCHRIEDPHPALFPGIEITHQNDRPLVVAQMLLKLKHLIEERLAQAKINAVAVQHQQGLLGQAIDALDWVGGTHGHLRRFRDRLEIARKQKYRLHRTG